MSQTDVLERRLSRALEARKQAEKILEEKALELYNLNLGLEEQVRLRTNQLAESENKYRGIIENIELGLLEVDPEGLILKAYPRFCEMIGYEEEELIGQNPLHMFVVPEFWSVIRKQDEDRQKGNPGTYQIQLQRKDEQIIWVLISGAPFYDDTGALRGTLGIHYDITESVKLRQELQRAKITAEKARRAEQNFLANMSHEIRTPLNTVIGMSHLLSDTKLDSDQKEYLDILSNSANVLRALISDILDISKIASGKIEIQNNEVNLPEILRSIEKTSRARLDSKPVEVICEIDPKIENFVISDDLLLHQILLNLVGNAEKFTEKGRIIIRAIVQSLENETIVVKIEVEDTGIGISEEKLATIFEQFRQADATISKKYGGTGLGLAITKNLVNVLGGKIELESELAKGSTFSFALKFKYTNKKLTTKVEKTTVTNDKFELVELPVLIVEDNELNQKYISKLFEKVGLKYKIANNGKEGFEFTLKEKFSLIFMDIQMPVMNGFDASKLIRGSSNLNVETPIVALTASTLLSKKEEAKNAGMSDYLAKPFNPSDLNKILLKYLAVDQDNIDLEIEIQESPMLDRSYLESNFGDDSDYAKYMFETFLSSTEKEILLIEQAHANNNYEEVSRIAHKIKPSFTMVGLSEVTYQMAELETAAKNGDVEIADKSCLHLIKNWSVYKEVILAELHSIESKLETNGA